MYMLAFQCEWAGCLMYIWLSIVSEWAGCLMYMAFQCEWAGCVMYMAFQCEWAGCLMYMLALYCEWVSWLFNVYVGIALWAETIYQLMSRDGSVKHQYRLYQTVTPMFRHSHFKSVNLTCAEMRLVFTSMHPLLWHSYIIIIHIHTTYLYDHYPQKRCQ